VFSASGAGSRNRSVWSTTLSQPLPRSSHIPKRRISEANFSFRHGAFRASDAAFISSDYARSLGDHSVVADDLLIAGLGDDRHPAGRACIAPLGIEPAIVKADCFRFRLRTGKALPQFTALQLTATAEAASAALSTGATRQRINLVSTSDRAIALPSLAEQLTITRFLENLNRSTQLYIRARKKLIALLNEQKQAIIHRAVTRGLDPSVRFKLSGVEWLGEVPEHWQVALLGRCLLRVDQGWSPVAAEGGITPDQWGVLTLSAVRRGRFKAEAIKPIPATARIPDGIEVTDGDLLLTRSNTRGLVGDACIVEGVRPKTVICDLIYRLSVRSAVLDKRFLMYQLLSPICRWQIEGDARGSSGTMPKISQRHIKSWKIIAPPLDEQKEIVRLIDAALSGINEIEKRVELEIDLLQEYRTLLIADVVTGKLDVREEAARLPEEIEDLEPLDEAEALTDEDSESESVEGEGFSHEAMA